MKLFKVFIFLLFTMAFQNSARAVVINFTELGINSVNRGQQLEDLINVELNPLGITFDTFSNFTLGIGLMTLEGPGLSMVDGQGFILNFDQAVTSIRVQVTDFKADALVNMFAYDTVTEFQGFTDPGGAIGGAVVALGDAVAGNPAIGTLSPLAPLGFTSVQIANPTSGVDLFDLTLNFPSTRSVRLNANNALWSVRGFEVELASTSVPEPGTFVLFGIGLAGLSMRRRRRRAA